MLTDNYSSTFSNFIKIRKTLYLLSTAQRIKIVQSVLCMKSIEQITRYKKQEANDEQ